jgi:SAM-dependent methyltransferase
MTAMSEPDNSSFHDFEHAGWELAAEHYADAFGILTEQTAETLLDAVNAHAGTRVLDVACGPGFVAAAAARRGADVIGLDFSPAMIAQAQQAHPTVTFREGDAQSLPFEAGSFDAVVMNFGLLHLARPDQAIAEAHRVLTPGGRYGFTIWAAPEEAVGFGKVLKAVEDFGRLDVGLPEGPPFFRFSNAAECRRVMKLAGFTDISVQTLPLTWRLRSADAVFEAVTRGGVRTAAVLRAQTADALERIRLAVRRSVERYARGDAFEVPMPAVLASGTCLPRRSSPAGQASGGG